MSWNYFKHTLPLFSYFLYLSTLEFILIAFCQHKAVLNLILSSLFSFITDIFYSRFIPKFCNFNFLFFFLILQKNWQKIRWNIFRMRTLEKKTWVITLEVQGKLTEGKTVTRSNKEFCSLGSSCESKRWRATFDKSFRGRKRKLTQISL